MSAKERSAEMEALLIWTPECVAVNSGEQVGEEEEKVEVDGKVLWKTLSGLNYSSTPPCSASHTAQLVPHLPRH